jgi:hypothetical protein
MAAATPTTAPATGNHSAYEKMPHDTQQWVIPDKYNKKGRATGTGSGKKGKGGGAVDWSSIKWDPYSWIVTEKVHGITLTHRHCNNRIDKPLTLFVIFMNESLNRCQLLFLCG